MNTLAPTAELTGDHLGVDVPGVRNARGVGGLRTTDGSVLRDGVLLRTAGLHALAEPGFEALRDYGVTTVIDLRGHAEATQLPDADFGARLVHLPLHEPDVDAADQAARTLRGAVVPPRTPRRLPRDLADPRRGRRLGAPRDPRDRGRRRARALHGGQGPHGRLRRAAALGDRRDRRGRRAHLR